MYSELPALYSGIPLAVLYRAVHICQSQSPNSSTSHVHMFIPYVCISIPAPQLGSSVPHDPAIPLLSISSEKTKIQKDTCTPVFIAALFTIAKTWKQPRCPSTDEWMKKMWYIYTMEYYSAIKGIILGCL